MANRSTADTLSQTTAYDSTLHRPPRLLPAARPTAVPLMLPGAGREQEDPGQRDLRPYRG